MAFTVHSITKGQQEGTYSIVFKHDSAIVTLLCGQKDFELDGEYEIAVSKVKPENPNEISLDEVNAKLNEGSKPAQKKVEKKAEVKNQKTKDTKNTKEPADAKA
jgi:hypothetical protein